MPATDSIAITLSDLRNDLEKVLEHAACGRVEYEVLMCKGRTAKIGSKYLQTYSLTVFKETEFRGAVAELKGKHAGALKGVTVDDLLAARYQADGS